MNENNVSEQITIEKEEALSEKDLEDIARVEKMKAKAREIAAPMIADMEAYEPGIIYESGSSFSIKQHLYTPRKIDL